MTNFQRRDLLKAAFLSSASCLLSRQALSQTFSLMYHPPLDRHPVIFWHKRSLELVSLDHSIDVELIKALGPCASSRALGIIHAVIADAVSHVYEAPYNAQFNRNSPGSITGDPALFVGGAAHAIMKHIYSDEPFESQILKFAREDFIDLFPANSQNKDTWEAGDKFGKMREFRDLWKPKEIADLLFPSKPDEQYKPTFGKHDVDPWNPGQGFYGVKWGKATPLVLESTDIDDFRTNEFKIAPEVNDDEIDLLFAKGGLHPRDAGQYKARTRDEQNVGLFWAYDGARLLGTPPVLYNRAVLEVAASDGLDSLDNLNIAKLARVLALCNLAMADAAIVAWEAKWRLAVWRPVLAIQSLTEVENWQPHGAPRSNRGRYFPTFRPFSAVESASLEVPNSQEDTAQVLLGASPSSSFTGPPERMPPDREYARAAFTPNFPSYPSGHATFGGACFEALVNTRPKGSKIRIFLKSGELDDDTSTHDRPIRPRDEVALPFYRAIQLNLRDKENALAIYDMRTLTGSNDASRVFLGVHWSFDQTDGDLAGRKVGDIIYRKAYA
jgi:membrane-associated phospholipid phosphatase